MPKKKLIFQQAIEGNLVPEPLGVYVTPQDTSILKMRAESKLVSSSTELLALERQYVSNHLDSVAFIAVIGAVIPCLLIFSGIISVPRTFVFNEIITRGVAFSGFLLAGCHLASKVYRGLFTRRLLLVITTVWMLFAYSAWLAGGLLTLEVSPELLLLPETIKQSSDSINTSELSDLRDLHFMAGLSVLFLAILMSSLPVPVVVLVPVALTVLFANFAVIAHLNLRGSWYIAVAVIQACSLILPVALEMQAKRRARAEFELIKMRQKEAIKKHEIELDLAQTVQRSLLPSEFWQVRPSLSIRTMHESHYKIGGDWMATRETADGRVIALVLDVTGKGMQAALVAHAVQSIWAMMLSAPLFDPEEFLRRVNTALYALGHGDSHTATAGIVEISKERLVFWSAGHCPLRIFEGEAGKESFKMLYSYGGLLGIEAEINIEPGVLPLEAVANFTAILGSDGIFDGVQRGRQGHLKFLRALQVEGWGAVESLPVEDDKTLIWIEYKDDNTRRQT